MKENLLMFESCLLRPFFSYSLLSGQSVKEAVMAGEQTLGARINLGRIAQMHSNPR
jgi:hypothetical protein